MSEKGTANSSSQRLSQKSFPIMYNLEQHIR